LGASPTRLTALAGKASKPSGTGRASRPATRNVDDVLDALDAPFERSHLDVVDEREDCCGRGECARERQERVALPFHVASYQK
jgi:hypothetical protein